MRLLCSGIGFLGGGELCEGHLLTGDRLPLRSAILVVVIMHYNLILIQCIHNRFADNVRQLYRDSIP